MKKFFAAMLVGACAFSLAACGQKDTDVSEDRYSGAGYDNPETCFASNFDYLRVPDGFKVVSADECGIVTNEAYVFTVPDDNHLNRSDYHSIIFREDGSASVFLCDVFLYDTMAGIYQYGEGEIFNIVTGDTIRVKSADEIIFSKNGSDYIGVRNSDKWFLINTPPLDDKYICTKNETTYAYQFHEDETVDYYENDVLIETLPCYYGDFSVGLRGKVYCFSSDQAALFIGEDMYTLGGTGCELPENALEYTASALLDDRNTEAARPDGMNDYGFYYDREYTWVYGENGSSSYEGISLIFKENGSMQIKGENVSIDDLLPEDLEYSYQKVIGKNFQQDTEFYFSSDGKILVYRYRQNPYMIFSIAE